MLTLAAIKIHYICESRLGRYKLMDYQYNRDKFIDDGYNFDEWRESMCNAEDLVVHYNFVSSILSVCLLIAAVWFILAVTGLMIKRCKKKLTHYPPEIQKS